MTYEIISIPVDCVRSESLTEEDAKEEVTEVLDGIEKMAVAGDVAESFNTLTSEQLA